MNVKRLKDVIAAVRSAPKGAFNMGSWSCGTTACAIGHYCRRHPRSALKLVVDSDSKYSQIKLGDGGGFYNQGAVAEFFGISYDSVDYLFMKDAYERPTRINVIRRIEQFIRDGKVS